MYCLKKKKREKLNKILHEYFLYNIYGLNKVKFLRIVKGN